MPATTAQRRIGSLHLRTDTSICVNVSKTGFPWALDVRSRKLNLSLECRQSDGIIVIHCAGRIVYREEAAAFSRVVGKALRHTRGVVLDLAGVGRLDSAGLGELVLVHNSAESEGKTVKLASANAHVREMLKLTNLSSVLATYPSVAEAIKTDDECVTLM
jgi:anti-anti-sigma factor